MSRDEFTVNSGGKSVWLIRSSFFLSALGACVPFASAQTKPSTLPSQDSEIEVLKHQNELLEQRNAALEGRMQSVEDSMKSLKTDQQSNQAQTSAAIAAMQQDATNHSQLLSSTGLLSGYDSSAGFVLRNDDGSFSFHPSAVVDFRDMTSYRERIPTGGDGEAGKGHFDTENGFDISRLRLLADGNFTQNIYYYFQFQADQGASVSPYDAYLLFHSDNTPFSLKVGQFKDPVWHERLVSEASLMAVDRTAVEYLLGGGQGSRVQGASLQYSKDRLRLQAAFHDGYNSINTKFFDAGGDGAGVGGAAGVTPTNFGTSGRAEFMVLGQQSPDYDSYKDYDRQFTALGDKHDLLVVGAAGDFTQAGANDIYFHTVDAQFDSASGFSAYAAYLGTYRTLRINQGVAPGDYYDPGFLVQVAYLITHKLEAFGRYDYTYLPTNSTGLTTGNVHEITVGMNYYLVSNHVKITLDGIWLPNGAPQDIDALGILKDVGHNEFVLRLQCQLAL